MSRKEQSLDIEAAYTAMRPLPTDPSVRADILHVLDKGFVVLNNCFTAEEALEARQEIARLLGRNPLPGRNPFEGLSTYRIYSLLNKSRVFDKFAVLPRVLALNDFFLDNGYLLTAFHTISITPGEQPQSIHHDDQYITSLPRPRLPLGTAIMVALSDYTLTNGATRIIPGSHVWPSGVQPQESDTVPATMPEGSVLYFISTLYHGGGRNVTMSDTRQSLTVQYCQPYIRPIENQVLAVDPRKLDEIDPKIVEMMGYRVMKPFMGYADGMNPRWAAKRLVRWLESDVDKDPPTFAHEAERRHTIQNEVKTRHGESRL